MLNTNTEIITPRLNEKMITNSEPITETIINANKEIGNPIIMACLRMFLYTSYIFMTNKP